MKKLLFILTLCFSIVASYAQEVKATWRLDYYMNETQGEFLVHLPDDASYSGSKLSLTSPTGKTYTMNLSAGRTNSLIVPIDDLSDGSHVFTYSITTTGDVIKGNETLIRRPYKFNATQLDRKTAGVISRGMPIIPFGFYCYSPVQSTIAEEEVVQGFNLLSPYQNIPRTKIEMRKVYMDRAAELGMKVNYNLLSVATGGTGYNSKQDALYNLLDDSFHEVMIMSPFLSKGLIKDFNDRNKYIEHSEHVLITRASELGKLKPADCSNFEIYTMKDAVVDGESLISEENASTQKQDIHAKIYMIMKYPNTYLYLGSLNASHNALNGNIEFMVKLHTKNRYLNLSKLKDSLFGTDEAECPFQIATLSNAQEDDADEKTQMLDSIIKAINRLEASAIIKENGERFDINLSFEHFESEYDITVSPLLSNKTAPLSENMIFSLLELTQLSEFYKISVSDGNQTVSRVIVISTENMPADREKAVVSSVVNDKSCFYRYIAFLLGDNMVISALESDNSTNETSGTGKTSKPIQLPALYEKMLKTAATAPERFKEIEYLIKSVSSDGVIPEGFEELYNTFRKVVKM